jgi:hypothetical protein
MNRGPTGLTWTGAAQRPAARRLRPSPSWGEAKGVPAAARGGTPARARARCLAASRGPRTRARRYTGDPAPPRTPRGGSADPRSPRCSPRAARRDTQRRAAAHEHRHYRHATPGGALTRTSRRESISGSVEVNLPWCSTTFAISRVSRRTLPASSHPWAP